VTGLQEATSLSNKSASSSSSSRGSANDTVHVEWLQVTRTLADNGPSQREVSTAHYCNIAAVELFITLVHCDTE
jgi:hypothetical protein